MREHSIVRDFGMYMRTRQTVVGLPIVEASKGTFERQSAVRVVHGKLNLLSLFRINYFVGDGIEQPGR